MIRYIAFYLPQFHPIEENDNWWGKGFTEWANVTTATPQFPGHQQPRLPKGMGFYDVRVPETRNEQFRVARKHGIDAFCYYYYWFNGRRLLNRPLDDVMQEKVDPFPFCICWANENWSRRWDGQENDILISQEHDLASDVAFIHDVLPVLTSPNYLRVDGKPILLIYRADRLQDANETTQAWRAEAIKAGLPGLHLAAVQSFGLNDVREFGFDSAVEFPPHFLHHYGPLPRNIAGEVVTSPEFKGFVHEYEDVVNYALSRPDEPYRLHRGLMCAWDNTARRKQAATVFHRPSPFLYEEWLTELTRQAHVRSDNTSTDQLVFINAWNEWAEGSVLEPCTVYGNSFLLATSRAKDRGRAAAYLPSLHPNQIVFPHAGTYESEPIVLIGHDAERNGAQINLLHFARVLRSRGVPLTILLLGGGPLLDEYRRVAPTFVKDRAFASRPECIEFFKGLHARGYRRAITNTVVTGSVIKSMKDEGFTVVSLVHELPNIILESGLSDLFGAITQFADVVVFASKEIQNQTDRITPTPGNKAVILPQGCYRKLHSSDRNAINDEPRLYWRRLGIPDDAKVVVGVGYGDKRKGIDMFALIAQQTYFVDKTVHFVWIGDIETDMRKGILAQMANVGWRGQLHLMQFTTEVNRALLTADAFLLTSREDPFPTVVLEALDAGTPVIAFKDAGGIADLGQTGFVRLVNYLDTRAMQDELLRTLKDIEFQAMVRKNAPNFIAEEFDYGRYVDEVCRLIMPGAQVGGISRAGLRATLLRNPPKISVVVPNYNAGSFLKARLASIQYQTVPPQEVILLDDASTDESRDFLKTYCDEGELVWKIDLAAKNSGSPFIQWSKGIYECTNDLVWIAESDDFCRLDFIEALAPVFSDPDVVLAYAHSVPVGENSERLNFNYDQYLADVDPTLWKRSFKMDGSFFASEYLTSRNTIPNASAVIVRRSAALPIMDEIVKYRACGDWLFYFRLAHKGKVAFIPEVLNFHRRHGKSVISKSEKDQAYLEELLMFAKAVLNEPSEMASLKRRRELIRRIESEYQRHRTPEMAEEIAKNARYSRAFKMLVGLVEGH
ncbi:glycoside hydrolase family 99-like domain-containing protein [Ensifer sp. Root127]|uniref:glycoside hydrolase family 99-like domain-containing protein n=1 Tax=Ensifer sp. Root127 TaxID=1736440 RepID=UPI00070F99C6|nr:glycoside hydrolase family 99-like domain-containing protein [Ensifer sp. Root127]KQW61014.1 hypothetical protein ASD03_36735 [Ensifer sp. Root127]